VYLLECVLVFFCFCCCSFYSIIIFRLFISLFTLLGFIYLISSGIFTFLLLHSICGAAAVLRLLSNIKGECQAAIVVNAEKVSQYLWVFSVFYTQRERERAEQQRATHASVSKPIIMYFFKTQKATIAVNKS